MLFLAYLDNGGDLACRILAKTKCLNLNGSGRFGQEQGLPALTV